MTALELMEMAQRLETKKLETKKIVLNQEQIKQIIPHREPFLFLDGIVKMERDDFIIAERKVTQKDCRGHFSPPNYVFPGHLACEALAQAGSCLVLFYHPELRGKNVTLAGTEGKFPRPIFPGDTISLTVWLRRAKLGMYFFEGEARLNHNGLVAVSWEGIGSIAK